MLKVIEKALLLQEIDVLEFVSADHLMQLAEAGCENSHKKGDLIEQLLDSPWTVYMLLHGRAALEENPDAVFEKAALNLCASLAGSPNQCRFVCLEECTVLEIAAADLMDLLAGEPEFCMALLKHFASKHLADSGQCP